jgi:hypothetical protein
MKVGQLFDLPLEISYKVGVTGNIRNKEETKLLAKYEVVEIEGERKGRVIVVYKSEGRYKCKRS